MNSPVNLYNPIRKLVVILGIPIDDLNVAETLDRLDAFVRIGRATGRNHQVATVNADFIVKAMADPELRQLLQESDMAMADGMPLVWGARLLGAPFEERVTGSDMVPLLAERAAEKGYSLYLLGAAPGIATRAAEVLTERHPTLRIAGVYSPPFGPILEMDPGIVDEIKAAAPDILLVAFGNPKQEKWIGMYRHQVNVPVMIGVGATLDFIAGQVTRAPVWMQKSGLEWLYRLLQEPRRLWRRYVVDMFGFGLFFVRQWWVMRRGKGPQFSIPELGSDLQDERVELAGKTAVLSIQGALTITNHESVHQSGLDILLSSESLILDLSQATFLDSTAIGTLVALTKEARDSGGELVLAAVPQAIMRTISMLHLDKFFLIVPDVPAAHALLSGAPEAATEDATTAVSGTPWTIVKMPRRLDALTAEGIGEYCAEAMQKNPFIVLDFSETVFLASAGLAILIKLQRQAESLAGQMCLTHCAADVLRVMQMVRFDQILSVYADNETAMADKPKPVKQIN